MQEGALELIYSVGWLIIAVAFFFLVALVFDRYGSHTQTQETSPPEELPPPEPMPEHADEEGSKFIKGLPFGDSLSFIGMDADGGPLPEVPKVYPRETEIKEVYPKRLAEFRKHKGFRSATFENFWRGTTGGRDEQTRKRSQTYNS